jgi:lysozyme
MAITSLRQMLLLHEGLRQKAYDDQTGKILRRGQTLHGNLTIGVGRNLSARGLTRSEVSILLEHDIARASSAAAEYPYYDALTEARQAVCVSMVFNTGPRGWGTFKKCHAALGRGDWNEASVQLLDSRWSRQVGDRALHMAELLRTGAWLE